MSLSQAAGVPLQTPLIPCINGSGDARSQSNLLSHLRIHTFSSRKLCSTPWRYVVGNENSRGHLRGVGYDFHVRESLVRTIEQPIIFSFQNNQKTLPHRHEGFPSLLSPASDPQVALVSPSLSDQLHQKNRAQGQDPNTTHAGSDAP